MSASKGKQTMKFGQLVEYNTRKHFPKNYTKCGGELVPDSFLKNQNGANLCTNSLKFCIISFYCNSKPLF